MTDVLTSRQRSFCMSRIRGTDTTPEVQLRKTLWKAGIRYRIKTRLPGRPDIVIGRWKTAIFVDGCFWHRCPRHGTLPKSNQQFWREKLEGNSARDRRVTRKLRREGWRVIRIWEHDVRKDVTVAAAKIEAHVLRIQPK